MEDVIRPREWVRWSGTEDEVQVDPSEDGDRLKDDNVVDEEDGIRQEGKVDLLDRLRSKGFSLSCKKYWKQKHEAVLDPVHLHFKWLGLSIGHWE